MIRRINLFIIFVLSSIIITSFKSNTKKKISIVNKELIINNRLENNKKENNKIKVEDIALKNFKIDSIFQSIAYENKFNGCVLVAQHGQILYKNSFGMANPVLGEPLTENSIFQLASVSKTITAVATLLLIEQNLLGLDDYVSLYFPEFPYSDITIRQLLCHRSGLPNYINLDKKYYPSSVMYYTNTDAYNALCMANAPREFKANSRFRYNNTNYALLGLIVEKISGMSFQDFVKSNIFKPLKMNNSYFAYPDQIWSLENRTFGLYNNNKIYPNDKFDGVFGDKGAYSTINDMYKFDRALYPNILLKNSTLQLAFSNQILEKNSKKYGLGFRLREDQNNKQIIYHNGWWHGYRTAFHRRETDNSCVIILSNRLNTIVYNKAKEMFNVLDNSLIIEDSQNEETELE